MCLERFCRGALYTYSAWASKLLIFLEGKFEGPEFKISNGYGSHAYFIYVAFQNYLLTFLQEVAGAEVKADIKDALCPKAFR